MTQLSFIILLFWYLCGSIMVLSDFEVIEEELDTKISKDYKSLKEYNEIQEAKDGLRKKSKHKKFPRNFRTAYPPSFTYLLWLKNNKQFPKWVYDMVRTKYHDDNLEWRINELSKLYRKCDMITEGFPLSGIYIKHLLDLINLQKRIDDHSIIEDINTKRDLEYLRGLHLPKANNSTIRLHLRDEDELLKKVDPVGYLKVLALRSPPVRNILYKKYLSLRQDNSDNSSIVEDEIFKDIIRRRKRQHKISAKKLKAIHKKIMNTTENEYEPIITPNDNESVISTGNYSPINRMQNVIDLIEDPGLNISKDLRKELRLVCKDYLNSYLQETCNLTNILKQFLELKQLTDDSKYKKLSNFDEKIERIENESKKNKNKEIDIILSVDEDIENKKRRKQGKMSPKELLINKNIKNIRINNTTAGEKMYSKLKFKSNVEIEKKKRRKFNKLTEYIENSKIYNKIKKQFSDNYELSKYDLVDVLENIGYHLPAQTRNYLTYLYGELLKNKQKAKLKELFSEQNLSLCFPNMKYEDIINMLTSLMLCNINNRNTESGPKLANVLDNLGFNMTKSARKKINRLYILKMKSNSKNGQPY